MEQLVSENLGTYGPWAVFILLMLSGVGLALGEEMVTIPAGVLIASGKMDFMTTAIVAYFGIVLADFMWFGICRYFGTPILHKRWVKRLVHPRRMLEAKHQLETRGAWIIVMARFIPSSRSTTITVAGMLQMPFWKFALATASCVMITVPIQLGLGYVIGIRHDETHDFADLIMRMIGALVLVIAVSVGIGMYFKYRASRQRPPRARASWLRRFRRHSPKTGPATASRRNGDDPPATNGGPPQPGAGATRHDGSSSTRHPAIESRS